MVGTKHNVITVEDKTGMKAAFVLEYSTDGSILYMGYFKKDLSAAFRFYPLHASDLSPVVGGGDHCHFKFKKTKADGKGYIFRDSIQIINDGVRDQLVFAEDRGDGGSTFSLAVLDLMTNGIDMCGDGIDVGNSFTS